MRTDEPRPNPLTDLGYETEDLHMPSIGKGAWIFFSFVFGSIAAGALLFWWLDGYGLSHVDDTKAPFMSKTPPSPNPLIQGNVTTKTDVIDLRKAEENALTTPAYVDQAKGIIRIPIDHAIDLAVQRLPSNLFSVPTIKSRPNLNDGPQPAEASPQEQPSSTPATTIPLTSPSPEATPTP